MKKLLPITLILTLPLSSQAATPAELMDKVYPRYNPTHQCRLYQDKEENIWYCMKTAAAKTISTEQGQRMLLIMAGDSIDLETNQLDGSHISPGMHGFFVLKPQGSGWAIEAARTDIAAGAFGQGIKQWRFAQLGPNAWGAFGDSGDIHQGQAETTTTIISTQNKRIHTSQIITSADNSGAIACTPDFLKDLKISKKACLAQSYHLEAKLNINKNSVQNGYYPIIATVTGHNGLTRYHNKAYTISFNAKGKHKHYMVPKNYPLNIY